uniref:SET domain-containing protein n=1 Tax=Amphora coffeiformis TaxID=265554 RepID=A0A7S3L682_9STRA|eukprot:scaffold1933_cov165-Amphora_coffeaeformis.AAC.7
MKETTNVPLKSQQREIPDAAYWETLRRAYYAAKERCSYQDEEFQEYDEELKEVFENKGYSGAATEFAIQYGDFGRGLFATRDIKQGQVVWTCEREGVFCTKAEWRLFLSLLPHHMQYDVVTWAYVMEWDEDTGEQVVGLDLEPSALLNHGGSDISKLDDTIDPSNIKPANLECIKVPDTEDDWQYLAATDIKSGDELLCDYSKFHVYDNKLQWWQDDWETIVEKENYY